MRGDGCVIPAPLHRQDLCTHTDQISLLVRVEFSHSSQHQANKFKWLCENIKLIQCLQMDVLNVLFKSAYCIHMT